VHTGHHTAHAPTPHGAHASHHTGAPESDFTPRNYTRDIRLNHAAQLHPRRQAQPHRATTQAQPHHAPAPRTRTRDVRLNHSTQRRRHSRLR